MKVIIVSRESFNKSFNNAKEKVELVHFRETVDQLPVEYEEFAKQLHRKFLYVISELKTEIEEA